MVSYRIVSAVRILVYKTLSHAGIDVPMKKKWSKNEYKSEWDQL
jgi:hypothetical protein